MLITADMLQRGADPYTHHYRQRMAERNVDEDEGVRALTGELVFQSGVVQKWYRAGVAVVLDSYLCRPMTVIREVRDEPHPRRWR